MEVLTMDNFGLKELTLQLISRINTMNETRKGGILKINIIFIHAPKQTFLQ